MALSDLSEIERRVLADMAASSGAGTEDAGGEARHLSSGSLGGAGGHGGEWVVRSSKNGHPYTKNRRTGEVIWLKPKGQEDDWEEYVDETGERCYYNKVTGATLTASAPKTNAYAEDQWSQFVDGDGQLHVYNLVTGESTLQPNPNVDIHRARRSARKDSRSRSFKFFRMIAGLLGGGKAPAAT